MPKATERESASLFNISIKSRWLGFLDCDTCKVQYCHHKQDMTLSELWDVDSLAVGNLRGRIAKFKVSHVARLISIQKGGSDYSVRAALPPPPPDHESGRSPASRIPECNFRSRSSTQMPIFGCRPNCLG